jgi:hypothetical protein
MAKLYGSIQGCRGAATRCGTSLMKASVQSYDGSVITYMSYDKNQNNPKEEKLMVEVCVSDCSSAYGNRIFYGTFEEFVNKLERED